MLQGETILSSPALDEKVLQALLMLVSLKSIAKGIVIALIAMLILAVFTAIASALCELATSISHLWTTSDAITHLLLLCLAVYCVKKAFPYIVTLHKKGLL